MKVKCWRCDATPQEAAHRGAFLKRVSPIGGKLVVQCSPDCYSDNGDQDDALISALEDE